MTPEQIRSLAIERIARHLYDRDEPGDEPYGHWAPRYRRYAEPFVDALGDLLPDGESWGVAQPGEAEPMSWWDTEDAEETVRKQLGVSAGRPLRRWLHRSWREVSEQSREPWTADDQLAWEGPGVDANGNLRSSPERKEAQW